MALENNNDLKELVRKAALLNAVSHGGKAQAGALVGKILGERADLRSNVKELSAVINTVVGEVNDLTLAEQKAIVETNWPETQKKEKAEEKHLSPLPNADKYPLIVTRFSPNPDCVLHLGSARAILLSHEYARLYKGKFILRFEDTDPKVKRPSLFFYDSIRQDLMWLGCKVDEEYIQSDRLPIYYEYTERLIGDGNAYICECPSEEFRKKTLEKHACPCRNVSAKDQLERWKRMLNGSYAEGQAVVRVKTDIEHPNPAVRDWPALRVVDTKRYPHPRVGSKYIVWPLYNLAAGLDDHLMGMTHIIRGKEHYTNMVRQKYMYQHLGWEYPEAIHYGRLKITGAFLSKSKIVQGVKDGTYTGYDDPRLGTFAALRKRGITPEAIKKMIIDVGTKPNDITLSWENLFSYNRKILDAASNRYFFVAEPIELNVLNLQKTFQAKLPLHPEKPERGFREYTVASEGEGQPARFWVSKKDTGTLETGKVVRLMELFNVKIEAKTADTLTASFASESYEDVRKTRVQLIQWILKDAEYPCQVVMPDASVAEGYAESACKKLKPNAIIQFERFGFTRIDQVNEKMVAYYAHK
ncbi:MAG TPA: glutamate--tRNA ligase [Candidatus Acidoferrales bacterium]|nr:glutamate--tRNA ligase [Candidatus Acidoferrales bacterium]